MVRRYLFQAAPCLHPCLRPVGDLAGACGRGAKEWGAHSSEAGMLYTAKILRAVASARRASIGRLDIWLCIVRGRVWPASEL